MQAWPAVAVKLLALLLGVAGLEQAMSDVAANRTAAARRLVVDFTCDDPEA